MPLLPCSTNAIDLASSSAFLKPSVVEMSGFGAPFAPATPPPERARAALVLASTLPCLARSSMPAAVPIATSNDAPFSIATLSSAAVPSVSATLFSVAFSNCGTSSSSTVLMAFELSTLTSAACAPPASPIANAAPSQAAASLRILMTSSLRCVVVLWRLFRNLAAGDERRAGRRADANDQDDGLLVLGAVIVHALGPVIDERAGRHRHRRVRIVGAARADPPRALDHGDEAVVRMPVRPAHIAGQPFGQHHVEAAFLVRIALQHRLLDARIVRVVLPRDLIWQLERHGAGIELDGAARRDRRGERHRNSGTDGKPGDAVHEASLWPIGHDRV